MGTQFICAPQDPNWSTWDLKLDVSSRNHVKWFKPKVKYSKEKLSFFRRWKWKEANFAHASFLTLKVKHQRKVTSGKKRTLLSLVFYCCVILSCFFVFPPSLFWCARCWKLIPQYRTVWFLLAPNHTVPSDPGTFQLKHSYVELTLVLKLSPIHTHESKCLSIWACHRGSHTVCKSDVVKVPEKIWNEWNYQLTRSEACAPRAPEFSTVWTYSSVRDNKDWTKLNCIT